MIRAIVALDSYNGIATNAGIPWDLPTDRAYFKQQTWASDLLMGYNTYKEMSGPLYGRQNYVWVKASALLSEGFSTVTDIEYFLSDHSDAWIIGGERLYRQTISYIDEIYVTRIEGDYKCTKFFPDFEQEFELSSQSDKKNENGISFWFQVWKRKQT